METRSDVLWLDAPDVLAKTIHSAHDNGHVEAYSSELRFNVSNNPQAHEVKELLHLTGRSTNRPIPVSPESRWRDPEGASEPSTKPERRTMQ